MELSMYLVYAFSKYKEGVFKTELDAIKYFYDRGIRYGTVCDDDYSEYSTEDYVALMNEAGLKPDCFVTTINTASFDKNERRKNIDIVKGYIDKMEKLNIPLL
ncbi:MAG: hypothetical protein IKJ06_00325, partial [Clostridia bacterium]|nr:hypothetical protein [Clostridia bacterium]